VCKGFEAGTGKLPHQVVAEVLGAQAICGALSGPSFAEEVAAGQPTAVALAANDPVFAREAARQLHSSRLRIYANDDLVGVEVGGAVKNVLAIATGVCDGSGLGPQLAGGSNDPWFGRNCPPWSGTRRAT
jgi:glycerol-3-phosphate dehydrogenase (NAD(P)+)